MFHNHVFFEQRKPHRAVMKPKTWTPGKTGGFWNKTPGREAGRLDLDSEPGIFGKKRKSRSA